MGPVYSPKIDAVVEDWKQNAKNRDEENYKFLRSMKFRDYGFEPDDLAGQLHDEAFRIVDCTRCANCCKTMNVRFDDEDIERIAGHLNMPADEFIETYLQADDDGGPFEARQKPCPVLAEDNRCKIYDVRPAVCREYPHTDKEGLVFRTIGVANNAIVYPPCFGSSNK